MTPSRLTPRRHAPRPGLTLTLTLILTLTFTDAEEGTLPDLKMHSLAFPFKPSHAFIHPRPRPRPRPGTEACHQEGARREEEASQEERICLTFAPFRLTLPPG